MQIISNFPLQFVKSELSCFETTRLTYCSTQYQYYDMFVTRFMKYKLLESYSKDITYLFKLLFIQKLIVITI